MNGERAHSRNRAAGAVASVFGILSALGGLQHGVGEILQGNVAPSAVVINSWVQGSIATNLGGEPGMTIFRGSSETCWPGLGRGYLACPC